MYGTFLLCKVSRFPPLDFLDICTQYWPSQPPLQKYSYNINHKTIHKLKKVFV